MRHWLIAALAASLGACAARGPQFVAPSTGAMPQHFADRHAGAPQLAVSPAEEGTTLPAQPWSVFADPTLTALQARAQDRNHDLETAALRLAEARIQRAMTAAQHLPEMNARGSVNRERQSENGAATRFIGALPGASRSALLDLIGQPFTLYQAGFDASWELDMWGRVRRSIEAADADTEAAKAALADLRLTIVAEVTRDWLELRSVRRQISLLNRLRANALDAQTLIDARYAGGLTDENESLRQQRLIEDLEGRLPPLLDREGQFVRQIELLCGDVPGPLASPADEWDASALPDLAVGVPSTSVERRADIAAAEARLHAATASVGVAVADLYPRITIGASFGGEAVGVTQFGEWASRQWSVGPSLTLPIFDAGRRRAAVTLRKVQQQEAAVAYQQTVLKAWHEVDAAISTYEAERQRRARLAGKVRESTDVWDLARVRFEHGMTDDLAVLSADSERLQGQVDLAESDGRLASALVTVYRSLGAGVADQ